MYRISFKFSQYRRVHLHDFHLNQLHAKIVPFAGYEMPVQYTQGVLKEHMHCRNSSGLFDVSHMGQLRIYGPDQIKFIETVTTGEFQSKKSGQSQLCLILNEQGGIMDDTIVAKLDDHIHMVVNAGNKFIDMEHMQKLIKQHNYKVDLQYLEDKPLIAVQGPKAINVIQDVIGNQFKIDKLPFMNMLNITSNGVQYQINRCGYTGEDGFEVSVDKEHAIGFCERLLKQGDSIFCGLGARDSLRLESGLCLHGHEMDESTTPYEAKLMWTVRKKNKETGKYNESVPFHGRTNLLKRQKEGKAKRIGFKIDQGAGIVRPPAKFTLNGAEVGNATSGTFSPVLQQGIGFAMVNNDQCKEGIVLQCELRGKQVDVKLCSTPFVEQRYYRE